MLWPPTSATLFPYTTLFRSPRATRESYYRERTIREKPSRSATPRLGKGEPSQPTSLVGSGSLRVRSEEHTSELQSRGHLVCRLLLEKKNSSKILSITNLISL